MELQDRSIKRGSAGTKVTSDPARRGHPTAEGAGIVAKDSLAAESVRRGGKFGQNKDSAPMSVEGSKSTLANTNTSGASKLPPARDSEARKEKSGWEAGNAGTSSNVQSSSSHAAVAPNYVQSVLGAAQGSKPKGKNLTEGGFDSDPAHNASFTSEIGTSNDPGRVAEGLFGSRAAQNPGQSAGAIDRGIGLTGMAARQASQPYGALRPEQEV